jgi:dihydroxyacetone kinase DhaKLM complex PTS-EIIA-like component DhaM
MIGLVLVGHSEDLVRGLAAMVVQAAPAIPVAGAAGLSGTRLGTNGLEVADALRAVLAETAGEDVLVLLDLGSAALAVDVALDELPEVERARVRVSEAAFVEGAIMAAVAAAAGGTIDDVERAAATALDQPKRPRG